MAKKEIKLVPGFLYNEKDFTYPAGKLFTDIDERQEALDSGCWLTGPGTPPGKKPLAQMNKAELQKEGAKYGLDLPDDMINEDMRVAITEAQKPLEEE